MKRTFVAIKIPFTKKISEIVHPIKLKLMDEKIKWVEEWNFHITMQFLGDTNENEIQEVCSKLEVGLNKVNSFLLKVKGVGVFKNIHSPKALWLGLEESKYLNELYSIITESAVLAGLEVQQRNFKPHLTIGRIRFIKDKAILKDIIEKLGEAEIDQIRISDVYFYESILTAKGPLYKVIQEFNLN